MKPQTKILLVEDEPHIAEGIIFNLKRQGHQVEWVNNGALALEKWKDIAPDLIVLDIMLPLVDGLEVLRYIRKANRQIPVLILSAKGQPVDRIQGLSSGGDDYLTKPFELEEFLLRVKKLLERSALSNPAAIKNETEELSYFEFGENKIDLVTYEAKTAHGTIKLTEQEIRLLKIFILNKGKILARKELLELGWGYKSQMSTRTLDNFIVRFRKYFESDPKNPQYFKSQRGKGYSFSPSP